jgi:hypothetical protein
MNAKRTPPELINLGWFFFGLASIFFCKQSLAQCPTSNPPTPGPPNSIVRVQVLSVKPNSDMEGDDDYIPFYDNHADIFGTVTIDGQDFSLPEIEDDDFPHWDVFFDKQSSVNPVKIVIRMQEDDWGLTGDNDDVDISPNPNEKSLTLYFDVCAMTVLAENNRFSAQSIIEIKAGTGDDQATIRLKIGTADGRPVTTNDLALVETDLVQVIFHTPKMIAGKPTIVMTSIANNYPTTITTHVNIIVSGAGVNRNEIFPLTLGAGEVKKEYFFLDDPIRFPESAAGQQVALLVRVEDAGNQGLDPQNCLRTNDGNTNRLIWKTVTTPIRYEFLWAKVGTLLDGFNFATDSQLLENMTLGGAYIHGVYPLSYPYNHPAPIGILPPLNAATDFLTTILGVFGIPADNVTPFALVFELNAVANIVGCDRLMGVLPNKDWFKRFTYDFFDKVTGLSLGEFAPHAVIFLPEYGDGSNLGPAMTLPAHELGHTFGLSMDPTLKDSWVCAVDWPILGHTACGIVGGFDEYKSSTHPDGNPSNGFWIAQGNEPASLAGLLNKEMCGTYCFMSGSPSNAHLSWVSTNRKWIDPADYDQLVNKLQTTPDPEVIYVSGIISWNDQFYFGSIQHIGNGIPDRDTSYGTYVIRFLDMAGKALKEVGLPVNWNSSDFTARPRPVTFFGLNVEFPEHASKLQIVNRMSGKVLGSKKISVHKPEVQLKMPSKSTVKRGENIQLAWSARDADKDHLQYFIIARAGRDEGWFPVEYWQTKKKTTISTTPLGPGPYGIKIMASDGIHVSASNEMEFRVVE